MLPAARGSPGEAQFGSAGGNQVLEGGKTERGEGEAPWKAGKVSMRSQPRVRDHSDYNHSFRKECELA